ncbi:MAG: sulfite exporter TauE/SafE family protein [Planctomycetota bacterium]
MIAAAIGAIIVGVTLGVLGSGGSILTVPLLVYLVGHEEKAAIAESLAIVGFIALTGAINRAHRGQVDWNGVIRFAPASAIGAAVGSALLAPLLPGPVQLMGLGVLMLVAAQRMGRRTSEVSRKPKAAIWFILAGLGVGLATGLLGVGGGFMIVPALVLIGGLEMHRATGTSLALIALQCTIALVFSDQIGEIDLTTVALFAALGAAGALGGQRLASKFDHATLKRVFAIFLVLLAPAMIVRELIDLRSPDEPPDEGAETAPATGLEP